MSPTWSVLVLSCNLNVKAIVDTGHAQGGVRHEDMRGRVGKMRTRGERGESKQALLPTCPKLWSKPCLYSEEVKI